MVSGEYKEIQTKVKIPYLPLVLLAGVIVTGTVGFKYLWQDTDATIIDAFYMTFITISTVGFHEVYPLDNTGRLLTIFVGVLGIGSLFYILAVVMENLFVLQIQNHRGKRKMKKTIEELEDHIILIGNGRVGKLAADILKSSGKDFVVIDEEFEENLSIRMKKGLLSVLGDATEDDVLLRAGIKRAKGMIVTTANSATNVFVVLSAKVLNPKIFIVARSDEENANEKIRRAGADRIVNPYAIGGQRLANLMINPNVVEFFETSFGTGSQNLTIENIRLPEKCSLFGQNLKEIDVRRKIGATILAIDHGSVPYVNPDADFVLKEGDQLVAFGTSEQIKNFEKLTGVAK